MSTPFLCGFVSALVLGQLVVALSFGVAAALRRSVTLHLLAALHLAMAVASGGIAGAYAAETVSGWRSALDVATVGVLMAAALNLEFAAHYARVRLPRRSRWVLYGITATAASLVLLGRARIPGTERIEETPVLGLVVRHVTADHSAPVTALCLASVACSFLAVGILAHTYRRGGRDSLALVVGAAALTVAHASDLGLLFGWWVHGVYLLPHAFTLYSLTIGVAVVRRDRESAGRLAATTHSLEQRTEELRRAYQDLRAMEGELLRREQLAAVGELAATIAHEVRNPLAIILNATAGLRRGALGEPDRQMLLGIVEEEVGRLNRLVADLLRFARPVAVSWGDVNLRELVERTRSLVPPEIAVEVDIPEERRLETVTLDAGLLRLVLENLVENACQAMPEGGRLSIVVRAEELEVGAVVAIEVRDTGRGMDARTLERALKPFFSTRPQGTGLGLAIVDRIVRAHGGTVSLESTVGRGTVVRLLIPLDEAARRRRLSGTLAVRSGSEGGG